jgi:heat shock protein HtpX
MYDDLVAGRGLTPWGHTTTVIALTLSSIVLLLILALAAYVSWLVVAGSGWLRWPGAVFLAGVLWCVRPRIPKLADDVTQLDRDAAPRLWALVDEVARLVGVPSPAILGVDADYNAYVTAVGWRRRRALVIGLPMWDCSAVPARLAVLGHELGHLAHRDLHRGSVTHAARMASGQIARLLMPDVFDRRDRQRAVGAFGLALVVRQLLALPAVAAYRALTRLIMRSRQRAEYLADLAGARVAGASGGREGMETALDIEAIRIRAQAAARRGEDPWAETARRVAVPERELLRRRRVCELSGHRTDESHPPTHLRLDLIAARGEPVGAVSLGPAELAGLEAELAPLRVRLDRQFRDDLLTVHYH